MYFVNNKDAVNNFTAQTSDQHKLYCTCFKIAELGIAADDIRQWFSHRLQNFIHDMDDAISGQIVSWRNTFTICSHNLQNRLKTWKYEMKKKQRTIFRYTEDKNVYPIVYHVVKVYSDGGGFRVGTCDRLLVLQCGGRQNATRHVTQN